MGFLPFRQHRLEHEERVVADEEWLTRLNIRAGWGLSGNLGGIAAYQSLRLMTSTGITESEGLPDVILGIARNENPNLTWEKTQTANVGMEWGFWHNRVVLTADYYYSYIYDMLYNYTMPVPPFIYDKMLANLGKMQNQGVEVGFGLAAVQTKDWGLNIGFNLTWQQNKLLSLNGYYENDGCGVPDSGLFAGCVLSAALHGSDDDLDGRAGV